MIRLSTVSKAIDKSIKRQNNTAYHPMHSQYHSNFQCCLYGSVLNQTDKILEWLVEIKNTLIIHLFL